MARFDIYGNPSGGYLLDLQADLLSGLNTRVVAPLMPPAEAPLPARRLNPTFEIGGERFVMVTQFMAAVPSAELRRSVASLAHERDAIMNALDMIFSGF
jgi:toxin CcdB